jgi:hypothetical protein
MEASIVINIAMLVITAISAILQYRQLKKTK